MKMGLVSRKSLEKSFAIHYADSLFIADLASTYSKGVVHDLGTGAGFPGIIFGIRYPEKKVHLHEKMQKKQTYLTDALARLALPNLSLHGAFPDRAESGLVLARAVMPRPELFAFLETRMWPESILITNLGGSSEDSAVPKGFLKLDEKQYKLPLDSGFRKLEIIKKVPRGT